MVKFEDKLNPPNVLVYDKHNRIKSLARVSSTVFFMKSWKMEYLS